MVNFLITGGCGFLGYHLITELKREFPKSRIKIIDLRENSLKTHRINDKSIKISLGKDITDFDSIKEDFIGFDTVIHCAGLVSFSLKDKKMLNKINVEGTKNVIKASVMYSVKDFIQISSVAALGFKDSKSELVNEDYKFKWDIAEKHHKYYMITKHLADVEVRKNSDKLNTLILYPGLMFGPGDLKNSAKMIKAMKDKKIPFNMPGGTNIIDVRDVARGIVSAIKNKKTGHYLLSGHNLSFVDSNKVIADAVKVTAPKYTIPKHLNSLFYYSLLCIEKIKPDIELTADNIDSSFKFRYFDNSKSYKNFGWKPKIEFKKTIQDAYSWMIKDGIIKV